MILANTLITDEAQESQALPEKVAQNIESFQRAYPGVPHRLFRGTEIREFLHQHYGREILEAYDALKPFAYKSDLARLCILAQLGGVYADLSVYFLRNWDFAKDRLAIFRDLPLAAPWAVSNTVFFAPPGHKALLKAIELILANVKDRYYGDSVLCPTGPVLFGKAVALTCEPEDLVLGDSAFVTPPPSRAPLEPVRSHCFVFGKDVVAIKRKQGGGPLGELGIAGGNEYVELWQKRDVYAGG